MADQATLETETAWLAEHDLRFQELITGLHSGAEGVTSLPEWVLTRLRDRGRGPAESAVVPWPSFQRAHPALARAGAQFLASAGLDLPAGVPRGEGYREQPGLDDWLVLLDDYALRCLAPDPRPEAAAQYTSISSGLRALGFTLTRQGIRRGGSEVDRLLTNSAAKALALADVVAAEFSARGQKLRALVLADTELAAAPGRGLADVLPADAGSAPTAVRAIAADPRTSALRPLLVTGRGLRCSPDDADELLNALRTASGNGQESWQAEPGDAGLVRLSALTADWQPRRWVNLATLIFTAGATRVLVGTRAMLGEGWDAPCVNCLVDLSSATTAVSVQQSRGRALRLDPADPQKIASNWDIVCVAPELTRGTGDYHRFVRKHLHLFAPTDDGVIEAGPSHVHPALGPFAPPADDAFEEINESMTRRAASSDLARQRWRIGEPYEAEQLQTLVILPRETGQRPERGSARPPAYPVRQQRAALLAGAGAAVCVLGTTGGSEALAIAGAAAIPAACAWATTRAGRALRSVAGALPLDLAARAICECYADLGELTAAAAESLMIEPRASGYLRCYLQSATAADNALFSRALDDVLCPTEFPRYLVSRLVPARLGVARSLALALTLRSPFERRWVAVPADLGRTRQRAEQYLVSWRRWLGPTELQFTQRSEAGRQAAAQACAEQADYLTSERLVWV